jgi:hypothetical protein
LLLYGCILDTPEHAANFSKYGRPELDGVQQTAQPVETVTLEMFWWVVRNFSRKGVVVLWDGVGTATVAALLCGRHAISIEPDRKLWALAGARIDLLRRNNDQLSDRTGKPFPSYTVPMTCICHHRHFGFTTAGSMTDDGQQGQIGTSMELEREELLAWVSAGGRFTGDTGSEYVLKDKLTDAEFKLLKDWVKWGPLTKVSQLVRMQTANRYTALLTMSSGPRVESLRKDVEAGMASLAAMATSEATPSRPTQAGCSAQG